VPSSGESICRLLAEKVPLLLLSGACSAVTFLVQRSGGAVLGTINLPVHFRVAHALVSYAWYTWKMIWPRHPAVHYPHPLLTGHMWQFRQVAGAAIFLSLVSVVAVRTIRRHPYISASAGRGLCADVMRLGAEGADRLSSALLAFRPATA
jgi:hypothetical protein